MRFKASTFLMFFLLILPVSAENKSSEKAANPLFYQFNKITYFNNLNPGYIVEASEITLENARKSLEKIYNVPREERTFSNTMSALDDMYNDIFNTMGPVYLMSNVHSDDSIRNTANEKVAVFNKFYNEVSLDENLYKAVKEYSLSEEAKNLTGYKKKFLEETVKNFERSGFALPKEKRDELKVLQDKISDLSLAFSKNIAEEDAYLIVEESDVEGLDEEYKNARRTEEGKYKIDLKYPSYQPFMKFSKSEKARKELYILYNNRAADKNLEILKEILVTRKQVASLLGYKTFAEYQLEDRMAKTPENVWNFENGLIDKLKEKARIDYNELLDVKRKDLNDQSVNVIQPWEASFYSNILLKDKYEVDQNIVKEYFEINNVINGLFRIAQHLFDVKFEEIDNAPVWHESVKAFNVVKDGEAISRFYLDLHPRPNKFSHAACFPMIKGKETADGYQMPTAALVCNFPEPTETQPALLFQSEVETFFHEFGHVLHNVLTRAEFSTMSGTSVSRDFVEAPSQIFENWVWNYDALSLFAKHYKTDELLPKELFDKMVAAKNVGSGLATVQQVFYGYLDMTYHDKYDPNGSESTTDVVKRLQNKITLYPYLEGTNFQAAFGHLTGYAAGYYGYLWANVYAQDMFSVFEQKGIMDKQTGKKYRDIILARGSSMDELELVKEFLGREPNEEAFLKSLGLN